MRHVLDVEGRNQLVESLRQFLEVQSGAGRETLYCPECGSVLKYLEMQFWLQEGSQDWNIALPYCQRCNPLQAKPATFSA